MSLLEKIFGNYSEKEIKRIMPKVKKIESLEDEYKALSDEALKAKTAEFKERYAKGESLDDLLPEAFAAVREAADRTTNMRPFHVQLIGGIVLHQGRIAEMKTGEGKTLVATMPVYLNALTGKGVHVVTVNDYLAKRDSQWMGAIFKFLGLSVGVILHHMTAEERREMYNCDITYATNNELGFDYLRDNMVVKKENMVLRGLHYAVIDEIDSILIDEARTPLIISGSGTKSTQLYLIADYFAKTLQKGRLVNETEAMNAIIREELIEEGDFVVDEKAKSVVLTQQGVKKAEKFFKLENLSDPNNLEFLHHINNALKANYSMSRDKDYVVQNGEVMIVDEFTGRIMPGRRYSDGLHQAIEAKEKVQVKRESKTLASVTFQNFFNKYEKKAGMTGTAQTEETEFRNIYNMDVVVVPTNLPVARKDLNDVVYKTERAKFRAVVREVEEAYAKGQPVLVGTVNIDKSEELSKLLKAKGIPHNVLNAKYHEQEAQIIAQAGQFKAVTIATNMAGRGTDIKLGEGVKEVGGLKIVGTERHESRRIDNQLRGRSGRQGDPGESRFFISLEDDLMRLFGGEKTIKMIDNLGIEEDEPIEHGMLTKAIENAQKKVEGNNFAIRKHLLEYDEVMNEQREIIYGERKRVLYGEDIRESIMGMIESVVENIAERTLGESENCREWNIMEFCKSLHPVIPIGLVRVKEEDQDEMTKERFIEGVTSACKGLYKLKEREIASVLPHAEGEEPRMREIERVIMLKVIDSRWIDHIDDMDRMRQNVSLQSVAQRDPLVEYKINSYDMFNDLSYVIQLETVKTLFHAKVAKQQMPQRESVMEQTAAPAEEEAPKQPEVRSEAKIGRNDPCPCGSGQKYKNCCGKNA